MESVEQVVRMIDLINVPGDRRNDVNELLYRLNKLFDVKESDLSTCDVKLSDIDGLVTSELDHLYIKINNENYMQLVVFTFEKLPM